MKEMPSLRAISSDLEHLLNHFGDYHGSYVVVFAAVFDKLLVCLLDGRQEIESVVKAIPEGGNASDFLDFVSSSSSIFLHPRPVMIDPGCNLTEDTA